MYWVFEGSLPWEKEISPLPNQIQRLQDPIKLYVETTGGSKGARIPRAYNLSINSFHFHAVFSKILSNNRFLQKKDTT